MTDVAGSNEPKEQSPKRIPYGLTDYIRIRGKNYYFVDKTRYLKVLPELGDFQFFIRPRRFGKSFFIALMECYFDVHKSDRFEELFKGTWIYDHPTEEKNQYLILTFNFASLDEDLDYLHKSFTEHVQSQVIDFLEKYHSCLTTFNRLGYYTGLIEQSDSASDILSRVLNICKGAGQKLYVIIDEYDNFTNTVLTQRGEEAYHDLTHGTGFFRSFFKALKGGTTGAGAAISRLFITGVSPITMDDLTSGFNIGVNVSIEPELNTMIGFTASEVTEMIEYYRQKGMVTHPTDFLLELMNQWYGSYQFSPKNPVKLFNSDMILYFLGHYLRDQEIPEYLIDDNVKIDYGKLRHLIVLDQKSVKILNGNFSKLKEIISEGGITATLVKSFPLNQLLHTNNFNSLLFYFGLLTIKEVYQGQLRLEIPNETIRTLFYNYIDAGYEEAGIFSIDLSRYLNLMNNMAYRGEWQPLFNYIFSRMRESMSLRDLITGEKAVQAFLNVYLGLSNFYIIHPEREFNKGYADLFLEPFRARYEGIRYCYLLELKYINAGYKAGDAEVLKLREEGERQLLSYSLDEKFKYSIEKTQLIKLVIVFSGHEAVEIKEAPARESVRYSV